MSVIAENITYFRNRLPRQVRLVAVSKTKPVSDILEAYNAGQRIFGENRVQELLQKQPMLPVDIEWHLIGHLQSNKVKYIAPFVSLIHSVDSLELLQVIDKEAAKCHRVIDCLLQVHIASEETKYGLSVGQLLQLVASPLLKSLLNVRVRGLMGIATFTENVDVVTEEFRQLAMLFKQTKQDYFSETPEFTELSMGMSGDYQIAIDEGSTLVRIGSSIFGEREYK
jgi:PLP dependent protein